MKIISLHIYGFGKFVDKKINLSDRSFQLFYGENEAGKSTILAFIRAVLFGFPVKQSKEARYEPKLADAYGGKITLDTDRYGRVEIERTKGKTAGGNVKIYFEDGTTKGEAELKILLAGVDKSVYQGIFSFGLQELHNLNQIESEELGKFLYGVGMAGKASIVELEKELAKKQDELFKPQGKKPVINGLIQELEQMSKKLAELQEEDQAYNQLLIEKEILQKEIEETKQQIHTYKQQLNQMQLLQQLTPMVRRREAIVYQLNHMSENVDIMPEDGESRLEQYEIKIQAIQEQLVELEKKKQLIEEKLGNIHIDQEILANADVIKQFQQAPKQQEQILIQTKLLQQAKEQTELELLYLLQKLGPHWNNEQIKQCDTSFQGKEELEKLAQVERKLNEKKHSLEEELERRSLLLAEKNRQEEMVFQMLPSYEEKSQLEKDYQEVVRRRKDQELLEKEMAIIKAQMGQGNSRKKKPLFFILLVGLMIILGIWSYISQQWIILGISCIALMITFFFFKEMSGTKQTTKNDRLQELEKKWRQYEHLQLELQEKQLASNLQEIEQLDKQYEQIKSERLLEEDFYQQLQKKLLDVYEELEQLEEKVINWCTNHFFPPLKEAEVLISIFQLVVEGKKLLQQISEQTKRENEWNERKQELESLKDLLIRIVKLDQNSSLFAVAENSMQLLLSEQEKQLKKKQFADLLQELEEEIQLQKEKKEYLTTEMDELFQLVNVVNGEEFRALARLRSEKKDLEKELLHVKAQIASLCPDEKIERQILSIDHFPENKDFDQLEQVLPQLEKTLQEKETLLIELNVKLSQLEQETSYSELSQQFEMKKMELFEKAKEWAIYKMSLKLLEDGKKIYETERQPYVMKKAKEFFSLMTNNSYVNLFSPVGENMFIVERKDGLRFLPHELSQGTQEQLYLSIRLALACAYQEHIPFPIMIDDILVNFDAKRREAAKKVIELMAKHHQILFFTCHRHICSLFQDVPIIRL